MGRARLLTSLIGSSALDARVSALEGRVDDIDDLMVTVNAALAALDTRVATAEDGIAAAVAAVTAVVGRPTYFSSVADNYTNVPIGQPLQSFWRSTHHVDIPNVKTGDKFLVFAQGQVRSDWDFNVECLPWLTWSAPPASIAHDGTGHNTMGFNSSGSFSVVGRNVRQTREHYFDWARTGAVVAPSNYASMRVANNLRCRSSDGAIDGSGNQALIIGTGQGGICAIKLN